ncbi:TetR/AcrR family transcriptional regulator [Polycladidibacter stylochi]|uniref:TetR/AcrR family transcriptional regulator n=1 Tax=Polycladidibacter stylochi TaxID=1807766 RepID=UPI0008342039|nr:TetR/AcrR family transcriptional regulator [Pseudovibrio stylochi]
MPKIVNKQEMREKLLYAALECYYAKGYRNTTMSDIAKTAGVAKGTTYLYFDSKDQLTESLLEMFLCRFEQQTSVIPTCQSLEEFIEVLGNILQVDETQKKYTRIFFDIYGPSFSEAGFTRRLENLYKKFAQLLHRHLKQLQLKEEISPELDTQVLSEVISSFLDGIVLHQCLFDGRTANEKTIKETTLQLLVGGLLKPKSTVLTN